MANDKKKKKELQKAQSPAQPPVPSPPASPPIPPAPAPPVLPPTPPAPDAAAIPLWQQITSVVALGWVLLIVTWLIVSNHPLLPLNQVLVRILISMASATWGAMIPATFRITAFYKLADGKRIVIQAVGAAAFFAATYWSTPKIFPESFPAEFNKPELELSSATNDLSKAKANSDDFEDVRLAGQLQTWKDWFRLGSLATGGQLLVLRTKAFDRQYLPFHLRIEFRNRAGDGKDMNEVVQILPAGCAYLVGEYDRIESQLDFIVKVDKTGKNPQNDNSIKIVGADTGRQILIMFTLTARPGHEKDFQISTFRDITMWKLANLNYAKPPN